MKETEGEGLLGELARRTPRTSFARTAAVAAASQSEQSWHFEAFRACRTFDEVKALAATLGMRAENDFGCVSLFRDGRRIASFWLFD
ncbi:MAG: hypothetical protein Q7Q73_00515 [Verrucomicrobiota bacterium JB024]|nr:hypothetical protein [Verrucomicrobiota bacterium JB024]